MKYKTLILLLLLAFASLLSATKLNFSAAPSTPASENRAVRNGSLKVLAVMVDFQEDTLKQTTGKGKFNSGYQYPDSLSIDAVDHNRDYCVDKLSFVNHYFTTVSNGKASLEKIEVLPDVVSLEYPIWYFNYNSSEKDFLSKRLVLLHNLVWDKVKVKYSKDFLKEFDTFVIFHAGSGQEFSLDFDETPFDIPSVYLDETDLTKFGSLSADNPIRNSIILPECEWQISDVNKKTPKWHFASMNGIMVLMFAHRFGLPNLYSSKDKKSGVGRFDLMDQGSGNYWGLIPSAPSAWSKEFMGWAEVKNLDNYHNQTKIPLLLNKELYRLDINRNEYYLMEYRRGVGITKDTAYAYDRDKNIVAKMYNKKDKGDFVEVKKPKAVITSVSNYDYALPASGTFIWQIDKSKTEPLMVKNNLVNEDYKDRGVFLVEADGSYDIGQGYWLLDAGYGTELGWTYDAFFDSNRVWSSYSNKKLYQATKKISFGPNTFPAAKSKDGTPVGITISNFSNPSAKGDTVYFDFKRHGLAANLASMQFKAGFGQLLYRQNDDNYLIVTDQDSLRINKFDADAKLVTKSYLLPNKEILSMEVIDGVLTLFIKDQLYYYTLDFMAQAPAFTKVDLPAKALNKPQGNTVLTEKGLYNLTNKGLISNLKGAISYSLASKTADLSLLTFVKNDTLFVGEVDKNFNFVALKQVVVPKLISGKVKFVVKQSGEVEEILYYDQNQLFVYNLNLESSVLKFDSNKLISIADYCNNGKWQVALNGDETIIKNHLGNNLDGFGLNLSSEKVLPQNFLVYQNGQTNQMVLVDSTGLLTSFDLNGKISNEIKQILPVGKSIDSKVNLLEIDGSIVLALSRIDLGTISFYQINNGTLDLSKQFIGESWSGQNSGLINLSTLIEKSDSRLVKDGLLYNWPNPVRDDKTNFRFYLTKPAEVSVDIYDLSGRKIDTVTKTIELSGEYSELEWNVNKISSGIYLALVTVKNSEKSESYKVKVSVIK